MNKNYFSYEGCVFDNETFNIKSNGKSFFSPIPIFYKPKIEKKLFITINYTNQCNLNYAKPFVQTLFSKNNELSSHRFCLQSVCYQTCFVNFIRSFVVQPLMNPFTIEELYKLPETFSQFLCT